MHSLTIRSRENNAPSSKVGSKEIVSKLLWLELYITVFLDVANELLGFIGFPLVLGQVVRACFLFVNFIAVLELGTRRTAQMMVLIYVFFAIMIIKEVVLGVNAIAYAGQYWAKTLLYISTFYAIRSAGLYSFMRIDQIEHFFKLSIVFVASSFVILAVFGFLPQDSFDSGYEGEILSKNSMSATLLMLFSFSLFLLFKKRISFIWVAVVAFSLFMLGSKSTILFSLIIAAACVLHEVRRLNITGLFTIAILLMGFSCVLAINWDFVSQVIQSQLDRYQYVMTQQGGSIADYLLTGRNDLLEAGVAYFWESASPLSLIAGTGVSALGYGVADIVNSPSSIRGIEMDLFEIVLASGVIGLTVVLLPLCTLLRDAKGRKSGGAFYLYVGALAVVAFMIFGGHVITEGMPASYFGIYLAYISLLLCKRSCADGNAASQSGESSSIY